MQQAITRPRALRLYVALAAALGGAAYISGGATADICEARASKRFVSEAVPPLCRI